jgi:hypothetical protein
MTIDDLVVVIDESHGTHGPSQAQRGYQLIAHRPAP